MKTILFDSHAILKYSQDEDGASRVEELLIASNRGELEACISEINLGEVYYLTIRRIGLEPARDYLDQFYSLPVRVVAPSSEIIL